MFFRDQHLDITQLKRVAELFGPLQRLPYIAPLPGEPDVIGVEKKASDRKVGVFGGEWYSDFSLLDHPPAGSYDILGRQAAFRLKCDRET